MAGEKSGVVVTQVLNGERLNVVSKSFSYIPVQKVNKFLGDVAAFQDFVWFSFQVDLSYRFFGFAGETNRNIAVGSLARAVDYTTHYGDFQVGDGGARVFLAPEGEFLAYMGVNFRGE